MSVTLPDYSVTLGPQKKKNLESTFGVGIKKAPASFEFFVLHQSFALESASLTNAVTVVLVSAFHARQI